MLPGRFPTVRRPLQPSSLFCVLPSVSSLRSHALLFRSPERSSLCCLCRFASGLHASPSSRLFGKPKKGARLVDVHPYRRKDSPQKKERRRSDPQHLQTPLHIYTDIYVCRSSSRDIYLLMQSSIGLSVIVRLVCTGADYEGGKKAVLFLDR